MMCWRKRKIAELKKVLLFAVLKFHNRIRLTKETETCKLVENQEATFSMKFRKLFLSCCSFVLVCIQTCSFYFAYRPVSSLVCMTSESDLFPLEDS